MAGGFTASGLFFFENFSAYSKYVTDSLNQWDLNQALQVSGLKLSDAPEVHVSNANTDRAIVDTVCR